MLRFWLGLKHGLTVKSVHLAATLTAVLTAALYIVKGDAGDSMTHHDDYKAKTLVIIGASYAKGLNSPDLLVGYQVINKGVNGQQSFEMLARFETDVVTLKPEAVLIWGFINDIFRSDAAQLDRVLMRARESLAAMVARAKQEGITPIIATEVTIRGRDGWKETLSEWVAGLLGKPSYQDYVNKHVKETNQWIRDLATREGVVLLDFEKVLADQHGVRKKEFSKPDGSHISEAGYDALARYTETRLKDSIGSLGRER